MHIATSFEQPHTIFYYLLSSIFSELKLSYPVNRSLIFTKKQILYLNRNRYILGKSLKNCLTDINILFFMLFSSTRAHFLKSNIKYILVFYVYYQCQLNILWRVNTQIFVSTLLLCNETKSTFVFLILFYNFCLALFHNLVVV